ncbi:hypothetical protein E1178_18950 [Roseibium hamelinense]|nr:hypothetical protein [Roseibium hamelinense]MTI45687.1 hypothetical protein [Roseibium hamelinense]
MSFGVPGLSTAIAVSFLVAGCAAQSGGSAVGWYNGHNGVAPRPDRTYVCHGFGCTYKTPVDFTRRDLNRLRAILSRGRGSPAAERRAIARAVSWQERSVAKPVGSSGDIGGLDMQNAGKRGQMDCIDEATNTTSLLLVAEKNGFLRHHAVSAPVSRGFFLDGRYPHATAAVREIKSGEVYAVDSWRRGNGSPPDIIGMHAWMSRSGGI